MDRAAIPAHRQPWSQERFVGRARGLGKRHPVLGIKIDYNTDFVGRILRTIWTIVIVVRCPDISYEELDAIRPISSFVDGVGAAMDIIGARMEQILPRCEDGKLHDLYDMEFLSFDHRRCEQCGEIVRGDAHVRYQTLQMLMKQKYCDWQREPGQEVEFDQNSGDDNN